MAPCDLICFAKSGCLDSSDCTTDSKGRLHNARCVVAFPASIHRNSLSQVDVCCRCAMSGTRACTMDLSYGDPTSNSSLSHMFLVVSNICGQMASRLSTLCTVPARVLWFAPCYLKPVQRTVNCLSFRYIDCTDQIEPFLLQMAGTIWEGSELPPNLDLPTPREEVQPPIASTPPMIPVILDCWRL